MMVSKNSLKNLQNKCEEYDCPHILDDGNCAYPYGGKPLDCRQELDENNEIFFERIRANEEPW